MIRAWFRALFKKGSLGKVFPQTPRPARRSGVPLRLEVLVGLTHNNS